MQDNKQKPLSIRHAELTSALSNIINESELPLILVEPIVADLYREIRMLNQRQLQEDQEAWEEQTNQNGDE